MKRTVMVLCLATALAPGAATAEELFPRPRWRDAPNPFASPHATVGGRISIFAGPYPQSFNYYLDNNTLSRLLFTSMYEALLDMDPVSAEYTPGLAAKWAISDDRRTFTFWIDPAARWSDGRPVTADDVKWTFDTLMASPLTGVHKVSLETFASPEVLPDNGIRFTASEVHWRNLGAAGGFEILPRHAFEKKDFGKINFVFPIVSGPRRIGELKEGISVTLERRADWWRLGQARVANQNNFNTILFRFYEERENAFESFKKGALDLFPVYTSRIWMNETKGEKFERNWIVKQKVYNREPHGFQGFAMNMRRPLFGDVRVRRAIAHLLDREKMNRTLMYSQYFMERSFFEDLYSESQPCRNPLFLFDKAKARQLLAEAGWQANPKTGFLEKNGTRFSFVFLTRSQSSDKFLAVFNEDLKDVGIEMRIDRKDAAAWSKDMDEFNYDMTWAAWGAGLFKDPEGMWSTAEADRRSGNNITGFKDPRVDALIEKQKTIFNITERNAICREIDALVADQCPYAFLWNLNYTRLLYWNRFGTPGTVLSKFGNEDAALWYWWVDEDAAADLEAAMESGEFLPQRPAEIRFSDVMTE